MRLLVESLRAGRSPGTIVPPWEVFAGIGNLTFEQLSTLRHRGAFSTVSLTFTTCCQLTNKLRDVFPQIPESQGLLREWYKVRSLFFLLLVPQDFKANTLRGLSRVS